MPTPSPTPSLTQGLLLFFELYGCALVTVVIGLSFAVLGTRPKTKTPRRLYSDRF
jgi:hypothetical protein